ncbi:hypothetical protein Maq22A_1p36790 (plasmid) [Methylobacterium aquaticum]|uniref:Uncharacterized protein n=2 Tax=Methylobacterium aquaticum TaxID=270351 RepID=A0A0C6FMD2_9HYPH|nr:hypothetical protein Maq22A_1p36790 [Methylobacterium aquaticum]
MHALERGMADLLSAGRRPRLADFGGLDGVVAEAAALCGSPFAPDFLAVVLDGADREDAAARTFVSALAARPRDDLALNGMVDAIAERAPLADDAERTCFASWLAIARDRERPPSLRTAALRGALLMKGTDPRRGARLAGEIAAIEPDDEASYIAHAARIGGLLHAEAPSPGVTAFLEDAARVDGAADEASFELGMIDVREIFAAADPVSARERIRIARVRFERAISERGARSDAHVLSLSLGLLADFEEGHPAGLRERLREVEREAFAYAEYAAYEDGFLSGARKTAVAAWAFMALRLGALTESLEEPSWNEARRVVEEELLAVYSASRSIFRMGADGGLEWLVRPRIERSVRTTAGQLHHLRRWLAGAGEARLGDEARGLIARIDEALTGVPAPDPRDAAAASPSVAAILEGARIPHEVSRRIAAQFVSDTNSVELNEMSPQIEEALARTELTFEQIADYAEDRRAKRIMRAVIWQTFLFLESRLDATVGQDPTVEYLFAIPGRDDPAEKDLQQDYLRHLQTKKLGSLDEVRGVGGGRSDIWHRLRGVRFITEVKKETEDASFEALQAAYGDQASMYGTTNVPIAILLVLDLTTREGRADHLPKLYRPVTGDLFGDGTQRGLLIIRVPARRIAPSVRTVAAKRATPGRRKASMTMGMKHHRLREAGSSSAALQGLGVCIRT